MQPKQDIPILGKEKNFGPDKDEKLTFEEQVIKKDHKNLGGKSLDTKSCTRNGLAGQTLQAGLFRNELLLFFKEVRFND